MFKKIKALSDWSIKNPKKAIWSQVVVALGLLGLVVAPLLMPSLPLAKLNIDTDPENMLSKNESVRVFHNKMRETFNLHDMVVVGIVNKDNPQGIFNQKSLAHIYELTAYAKNIDGVISKKLLSPSTVDSIEAAGKGVVNFNWLMSEPPKSEKDAHHIFEQAQRIPFLNGTLVSEDKQAIAIYIPITSKDLSYKIAKQIKEKAKVLGMTDDIHIAGLPIAQDQFGKEMFTQMAISAPLAMILIFILMLYFFKNFQLILSPMIVALLSVIITMGLLVITGNTVHIMSSMIPIFIMPIAVLDAVHILSDFFDIYHKYDDREKALDHVMEELSTPMLYTSITTVIGFASLAFTPIPPVSVFGLFVALGVGFAWFSTVTFIPAYIMLMNPKKLKNFGLQKGAHDVSKIAAGIHRFGEGVHKNFKPVLALTLVILAIAYVGINKIVINDNPVKWFSKDHNIRIADKELNERLAGTYMAYLTLQTEENSSTLKKMAKEKGFPASAIQGKTNQDIIEGLQDYADGQKNDDLWYDKIDDLKKSLQLFKSPETLAYIEKLQAHLLTTGIVGKSSSIADVIKTVHRDLYEGKAEAFRLPDSPAAVAQTLITYQNSHRPSDLWHFVTPDYSKANLWIQLNSGDNQDMNTVIESVKQFQTTNPAPFNLKTKWFGMTYINVIWQDKMVNGMMKSFLGSFLIVLLLMTILFRSIAWGALAMLPLTITIGAIYGLIGFIGKDYDMPIAVLSSLSLGLAVDYAIHFLARAREIQKREGTWKKAIYPLFGEPGRAIFRNVIVISIGFMPLLLAPLVPYQTVGVFISAILFFAGIVTLAVLPATITLFKKWLFVDTGDKMSLFTKAAIVILLVGVIVQNFIL